MAEKSDARIEQLEKAHQESQEKMSKMMEILRALMKEKGQITGPSPQNEIVYHEQRKEEGTYPIGFNPPYGLAIHVALYMP